MYVYWFAGGNKNKNKIFCSKVIYYYNHYEWIHVYVDPNNGGIPKICNRTIDGITWLKVPYKEGEIRYRTFWLEKKDDKRALDIVNDYLTKQAMKALDKIAKKSLYTEIIEN